MDASDSRRRRIRRRRIRPRFFLMLALLLLAGYVLYGYAEGFVRIMALRSEITHVQREIEALHVRNDQLRAQIEHLESDEYVERVAREELGLVKPGETAYVVAAPEEDDPED